MERNKIILAAFLILVFACKKPKQENIVDFKYEYTPQVVGHYCVYDIIEINHDDAVGLHETLNYKLKERIESTFIDAQGRPSLRLERSKINGSGNWYISDVWYSTRTTTLYEKIEEDIRYTRMTFPVKKESQWNGNATNTLGGENYAFSDVDVARSYNSLNFLNTTRVQQNDEWNFVQRKYGFEVYAKNVGLVRKYFKDLVIDSFDTLRPKKGNEYYMTILYYGIE